MSRTKLFSTAVVLSPGAWQHVIAPDAGYAPVGRSTHRLEALLNSALTFTPHDLQFPVELPFDHPQSDDTSVVANSSPLQLAHITPRSGPAFLLIRLPSEIAVDLAAI
ncbi:hypothetical protein [Pseudomonas umsongensis]|uniref:hypothetical protein n=1 Tax=Pseudomonas umsongensis TaxID=198618 RepID=UPI00200AC5BF|nr:hypothetical protein [Pseudomonas umsongensis]MCK8682611.1 hypothetical protein [Pseudomonas umsongensis]